MREVLLKNRVQFFAKTCRDWDLWVFLRFSPNWTINGNSHWLYSWIGTFFGCLFDSFLLFNALGLGYQAFTARDDKWVKTWTDAGFFFQNYHFCWRIVHTLVGKDWREWITIIRFRKEGTACSLMTRFSLAFIVLFCFCFLRWSMSFLLVHGNWLGYFCISNQDFAWTFRLLGFVFCYCRRIEFRNACFHLICKTCWIWLRILVAEFGKVIRRLQRFKILFCLYFFES